MFVKMCDNFEELSETYFRFSVALVEAEFGFLTKLNDSTTMKGKCYDIMPSVRPNLGIFKNF